MKVKSVTRIKLDTPVPVFDLSVPGPDNFKLAYGPFVHNSKDVSDALAGVVYGLTTRREIWSLYSIPLGKIPESLKAAIAKDKEPKTLPKPS